MATDAKRWNRLGGVAAVALLHVVLAWALLTYSRQAVEKPQRVGAREVFFYFPPHKQPTPQQSGKPAAGTSAPSATLAVPALSDYRGITIPDSQGSPTLGLNRSLFGCSPQEVADLPPQERARCANAFAPDAGVDYRDGTGRARDAALWERQRARKNAPLLLPCMSPQGVNLDIICLAKGAIGGFDLDNQSAYADAPEDFHLPNNGDPPDKPTSQ